MWEDIMAFQKIISGSFVVGQSESNAVQLNEGTLVGLTVSGSTLSASSVTFLASADGVTYLPLYDDTGTEVALTVSTAARNYTLDPSVFFPWNFIKARQGTSASAVLQAGQDTLLQFNVKTL